MSFITKRIINICRNYIANENQEPKGTKRVRNDPNDVEGTQAAKRMKLKAPGVKEGAKRMKLKTPGVKEVATCFRNEPNASTAATQSPGGSNAISQQEVVATTSKGVHEVQTYETPCRKYLYGKRRFVKKLFGKDEYDTWEEELTFLKAQNNVCSTPTKWVRPRPSTPYVKRSSDLTNNSIN